LTLLNGLLLVGAGLLLLLLSWLVVASAMNDGDGVAPGTKLTLRSAEGERKVVDYQEWQDGQTSDVQGELLLKGMLALVLIGGAGTVGGYLLTGRALRPLHQVTRAARRLSTDTLDQRIAHPGPDDEVKELADTFDAMLDRLAAAFGSQRRFVANASHELRTPLAVMRTEIDVTLADPHASDGELRRMGAVVRAASTRANELIEALLLLARTEAQAGRRLSRKLVVDLGVGVPATLSAVRGEIERLRLRVETEFGPAAVVGDPSLLERLAGNLIENAVRYNHTSGSMTIRTGTNEHGVFLTVTNTGPVVEPSEVPGLFEPFRRGGAERTGTRGAGLGLSIVRAVADAHGGTVRAVPAATGGLTVTILLPAANIAAPVS
jgi:signal transduction histidine kinase